MALPCLKIIQYTLHKLSSGIINKILTRRGNPRLRCVDQVKPADLGEVSLKITIKENCSED